MPYQYVFDPKAAREYEDAFEWYEERSATAAENLVVAVNDAISAILNHPYRFRNSYKSLREISLKKFPYNLIYLIIENESIIIIISLYHYKRDPKGKYSK